MGMLAEERSGAALRLRKAYLGTDKTSSGRPGALIRTCGAGTGILPHREIIHCKTAEQQADECQQARRLSKAFISGIATWFPKSSTPDIEACPQTVHAHRLGSYP